MLDPPIHWWVTLLNREYSPFKMGPLALDSFLGTTLTGYVLHCIRWCQYNEILFLQVISCGLFLLKIWETFWEGSGKRLFPCPLGDTQSTCETWNRGLDSWRAASVLLAQASLLPSSWYRQHRRLDWTPSWCGACAHAPGSCSWSVRTCESNSTASRAWGPWGSNIAVYDWRVAMNLTLPW